MEIIPAIMPANYRDLEKKVEQVVGSVKTIQLDLMDGKYVTAKTWPLNDMYGDNWLGLTREEFGMPHWEAVDYELDLMVNDIPNIFAELVTMGPKRIIFHFPTGAAKIEELKNFIKNLDTFYKYEIELGIAYDDDDSIPNGDTTGDIRTSASGRDFFAQGDCDSVFLDLIQELGWLEELWEKRHDLPPQSADLLRSVKQAADTGTT